MTSRYRILARRIAKPLVYLVYVAVVVYFWILIIRSWDNRVDLADVAAIATVTIGPLMAFFEFRRARRAKRKRMDEPG